MYKITQALIKLMSKFQSLSLLAMRFTLALGFYKPALNKLYNFNAIVDWFSGDLGLPYPWIMAFLAASTEALGVIFLVLGFKTRFIAVPLMVVMFMAINTVHFHNGFSASNNGFEIPFYYLVMLSVIATHGPGKYSLDETFLKKYFGTAGGESFKLKASKSNLKQD
jgi:putative oxidoreductase